MRPPVCAVCDNSFDPQTGLSLRFTDYSPLPENITGHPKGEEWFCELHSAKAKELTEMNLQSALNILKSLENTY